MCNCWTRSSKMMGGARGTSGSNIRVWWTESERFYAPFLMFLSLLSSCPSTLWWTANANRSQHQPSTTANTLALFGNLIDRLLHYTPEETLLAWALPLQGKTLLVLAAKVEASVEDTNSHKLKQGYTLLVSCPRGPMGGVAFFMERLWGQ